MLLALLMLVAGRLGGADGGPMLAVDTVRISGGVADPGMVGEPELGGGIDTVRWLGGGTARPPVGGGVPAGGGRPVLARDMPRGGGGVAVLGA